MMKQATKNGLELLSRDLEQLSKALERLEDKRAASAATLPNGRRSNGVIERDNATVELFLACRKAGSICHELVWLDAHYALDGSPETFLGEAMRIGYSGQTKLEDLERELVQLAATAELSQAGG